MLSRPTRPMNCSDEGAFRKAIPYGIHAMPRSASAITQGKIHSVPLTPPKDPGRPATGRVRLAVRPIIGTPPPTLVPPAAAPPETPRPRNRSSRIQPDRRALAATRPEWREWARRFSRRPVDRSAERQPGQGHPTSGTGIREYRGPPIVKPGGLRSRHRSPRLTRACPGRLRSTRAIDREREPEPG